VLKQPYPTPKLVAPLWQEFEILRLFDFPGVEKAYSLENHQQWWMIALEDFGQTGWTAWRSQDGSGIRICLQRRIPLKIHAGQVSKNISLANIFTTCQRPGQAGEFSAALVSQEKMPSQPHQPSDSSFISELTG
jgi:hypothetical protein